MIAEVIIDIENKQVNKTFDYTIPTYLEGIIKIGCRVLVEFGRLRRVGYVVALKEETSFKKTLKSIIEPVDIKCILNEEFIEIAKYIAENNFSFYATALNTMIPTALKIKYHKVARIINDDNVSVEAKNLFKKDEIKLDSLDNDKQIIIYKEVKKGNIIIENAISPFKKNKEICYVHLLDTKIKPTSRQGCNLVEYLKELGSDIETNVLINDSGYSKSVINTLEKLNIIEIYKKEIKHEHTVENVVLDKKVELNDEQKNVFKQIKFEKDDIYLLHGVTGSGKTEVYMKLISEAISINKTALLLVPEISLTPQITAVLLARFKNDIAILHSRLNSNEKYTEWQKIVNKQVKIVVGARSAIFAPLENLGIIIIDEEHESTYIQHNNPKYNTIDIAKIRSKNHSCPLVLGSATPNIIDYYYSLNGKYKLLSLSHRANNMKPDDGIIVDMREELKCGNKSVLSNKLSKSIIDCYKKNEQSILFLNRRGFSSFVMCRSCGESIKCPHCDVSLTFHKRTNMLTCHYCGYSIVNPSRCPSCGSDKIKFVGSGTEKIVEAVQNLLPEARIIRLDQDSVSKIDDYENAYFKFKNHEADILIGTQMVTKGLDFDLVTLVGVVNADLALSYPTYDATMVAYNLIEQVSGRAGRASKKGEVIIQTYNPEHYVIKYVSKHDYLGFYKEEIKKRKLQMLPPFSSLIEIVISSENKMLAYNEAVIIVNALKSASKESIILGPAEDFIFKKNDTYFYKIQIQMIDNKIIEKINYIYPTYQNNKDVNISITRM